MKLYCGIDLHSNNHWLTLINEHDERLVEERLANVTLAVLEPYRGELEAGILRSPPLDDFLVWIICQCRTSNVSARDNLLGVCG